MRENGRWQQLTDFQRLLVALAIAGAIFLSAISLGARSIIPLLIAMLLLVGAGLSIFLFGLRLNGRATVQGHAYVIMAQPPPIGNIVSKCDMRLLVDMPGQPQNMVKFRDPSVPVTKWPTAGMTLPVEVSPRNPRQLRVRWDQVDAHILRPTPPIDEEVPFYTQFSDHELKALTDGRSDEVAHISDVPPPPVADEDLEDYLLPESLSEAVAPAGPDAMPPARPDSGPAWRSDPFPDSLPDSFEDSFPDSLPDSFVDQFTESRPSMIVSEPDTILGDEIIIPPHLTADLSPEPGSRPADFDLPMRSIPQPRPAEPTAQRHTAASQPVSEHPVAEHSDDETPAMGMMLVVSDLNRSLRFYRDLVGFTLVDHGANVAVLDYSGGRILLRQLADMSPVDRRVAHLHITVPDVDASYKDLKDRGVEFVHRPRVTSRGDKLDLWAATFRDPDGHDIALTQWRTRESA